MAKPFYQLLAESLHKAVQVADHAILRSNKLSRVDRERLIRGKCLLPIIRGSTCH